MPRPARLSREKIAEAALAIADSEGLEALSMRRLAKALGVGAMSLYNHVRDKADLEALLVEGALRSVDAMPAKGSWEVRAKEVLHGIRDAMAAHPGLVPLLLKRPTYSAEAVAPIEALLAALHDGGFRDIALLRAYHTLLAFLTGSILTDLSGAFSVAQGRSLDVVTAEVRELDPAAFPHLTAIGALAAQSDPEKEFDYGLAIVFDGLKKAEWIKR